MHSLATLGATAIAETKAGLAGLTKCTYFAKTTALMGAPAFSITKLDYYKFQLHYAEWCSADMTGQAYLPASNKYTGTYTASTYPSPLAATYPAGASGTYDLKLTWPSITGSGATASRPASMSNWTPESNIPGSWAYQWTQSYSNQQGMFMYEASQPQSLSSSQMLDWMSFADGTMANYNAAVDSYNTDKAVYNSILVWEAARNADIWRAIFEPATFIPTRPA